MTSRNRLLIVGALVALLVSWSAVATASAFTQAEEGATTTTTVDPNAPQPAEPAPAPSEPDTEPPWTARYIIPIIVVVSLGLIVGLAVYYAFRVKGRYEVV